MNHLSVSLWASSSAPSSCQSLPWTVRAAFSIPSKIIWSKGRLACIFVTMFVLQVANGQYRRIDQYHHTNWTAKDGVPAEIHDLTQTSDGFLWLGTTSGLFRFDGVRFEQYRPEGGQSLQRNNILSLCATEDGGLWIGYTFGGTSFLEDGKITHYGTNEGLPASTVKMFAIDETKMAWAALTDGSLVRFEGGRWKLVANPEPAGNGLPLLLADAKGSLWFATERNIYVLRKGGQTLEKLPDKVLGVVGEDSKGRALVVLPHTETAHSVNKRVTDNNWFYARRDRLGTYWGTSANGSVWHAATLSGILEDNGGLFDVMDAGALAGFGIYVDREGTVWGLSAHGLDRYRADAVIPLEFPSQFSRFQLARSPSGGVFATSYYGLNGGAISLVKDGHILSQEPLPGPLYSYIDPKGVLWIGTRHGGDILRQAGNSREVIRTPAKMVGAMTEDPKGRLWALMGGRGFFRYEDGKWATSLASLGPPNTVPSLPLQTPTELSGLDFKTTG